MPVRRRRGRREELESLGEREKRDAGVRLKRLSLRVGHAELFFLFSLVWLQIASNARSIACRPLSTQLLPIQPLPQALSDQPLHLLVHLLLAPLVLPRVARLVSIVRVVHVYQSALPRDTRDLGEDEQSSCIGSEVLRTELPGTESAFALVCKAQRNSPVVRNHIVPPQNRP